MTPSSRRHLDMMEYTQNSSKTAGMWLSNFYSLTESISRELKKSKIDEVPKPSKPKDLPESYRSIAFVSSCLKLCYETDWPAILEHVPIEQARHSA